MNYLVEIRLFYDRIEIVPLSSAAIVLWHTLMYLANKAGWPEELSVSIGTLIARSRLERRGVYRARIVLRDEGFIEFREQTGNRSALYKIISQADLQYENVLQNATQDGYCGTELHHKMSHTEGERYIFVPQNDTQRGACSTKMHRKLSHTETEQYKSVPQIDTQDEPCSTDLHHKMSHTEGERYKNVLQIDTQSVTQTEPPDSEIHDTAMPDNDLSNDEDDCRDLSQPEKDPYISIYINKDIDKGGYRGKKKNGDVDSKSPKKRNTGFDLSFIGDEVWEALVESWLEYKRSRSENYKSEMSVKKFHTMLRNYSRGDPGLARQIIDKSIANNWAGIFELAPDDGKPRNAVGQPVRPATGQRIGQIKQPEDEERRRKLLEKFGRGACPERDSGGSGPDKK